MPHPWGLSPVKHDSPSFVDIDLPEEEEEEDEDFDPEKVTPSINRADHKKLLVCCAPTYPPKLALPKKIYGHFEGFFFFKNLKPRILFHKIIFSKTFFMF